MTQHLQRDLEKLTKDILHMGSLVEEALRQTARGLVERSVEALDRVIADDRRLDGLENAIDDAVVHLLALHRPVAGDLRLVLAIMQVNHELERMGDHAKNIAKLLRLPPDHPALHAFNDGLAEVVQTVLHLVKGSLDALINRDGELARWVREQDREVDQICNDLCNRLIAQVQDDPALVERAVQAINGCRNLERIADLAKNIAKDAIFLAEGHLVRHGGRMEELP